MEEGKEAPDFSASLLALDPTGKQEALEGFCEEVFVAALNGWLSALNRLLSSCTYEYRDAALRFYTKAGLEKLTPLVVAAKTGHLRIVEALVTDFNVDIDRPASVMMGDTLNIDATALWCAAACGHFDVVKVLVAAGARVNHACATKSTPLHAACYIGNIDIVSYLISNGADVNSVDDRGCTCLMLASFSGDVDVARCLVEHGANIDYSHDGGTSALHLAAEEGNIAIVTYLISRNASLSKNEHGLTPIMAAAANGRVGIVEWLAAKQSCGPKDRIEAYELIAASLANSRKNVNLSLSFNYMHAAMLQRERCGLTKSPVETLEDYDFQKECCSLAELVAIKADEARLGLEALLIQERILGLQHPAVAYHLEYRAAWLAEAGDCRRGVRLLLRAAQAKLNNEFCISKELWRITKSFGSMLEAGEPIPCTLLKRAMELVCLDISAARKQKDDEAEMAVFTDMQSMLNLVAFATQSRLSKVESFDLRRVTYRFCKMDVRLPIGFSLLHMAVSHREYADFRMADDIIFPSSEVASWLLECGHSADCRDNLGNTPLHIAVQLVNPINDFTELHDIIMLIAKYCGHLDCTNVRGKTALQCCATGVAEVILRLQIKPRLMCLAARAVKRTGAGTYEGVLPKDLLDFVNLH